MRIVVDGDASDWGWQSEGKGKRGIAGSGQSGSVSGSGGAQGDLLSATCQKP